MNATPINDKILPITQIISCISAFEPKSFQLKEFISNLNLLIWHYRLGATDEIREWLDIYDMQANSYIEGTLIMVVCHPDTLPDNEIERFKEEFDIIKDFVQFVRESVS